MSLNKGKAKVKVKSKPTAKTAGTKKKAVMNSRSPKKPTAISGDTMSNYAMYKRGGKVSKIKKYQPGGENGIPYNTSGPRTDHSQQYDMYGAVTTKNVPKALFRDADANRDKLNAEMMKVSPDQDAARFYRGSMRASNQGANDYGPYTRATAPDEDRFAGLDYFIDDYHRKKGGTTGKKTAAKKYKAGGTTKAKKFAALAPPYNKATAADRIAGAKKNARKK